MQNDHFFSLSSVINVIRLLWTEDDTSVTIKKLVMNDSHATVPFLRPFFPLIMMIPILIQTCDFHLINDFQALLHDTVLFCFYFCSSLWFERTTSRQQIWSKNLID